ncbi:hypothetical protein [Nocardiopsis sp. RV163]|uniref:hypothetical protein n=1 Tax=Nocardiopsis sp. RV163 TaxID=1661388 RepID=UPI00064B8F47|nr:hypothetical protein [Nocardiopsis sp. RV163]
MTTATATDATTTMEILLDQGAYRHLRFQRGPELWEVHTFPGGLLIRGFGDYVLINGADDILESMSFTQADPAYWSEKVTAGTVRVWDETAVREHLAAEADRVEESQEVRELLEMAEFHSEALAREALAGADIYELFFPEENLDDFYVLDPMFVRALDRAHEGLALYADRQS